MVDLLKRLLGGDVEKTSEKGKVDKADVAVLARNALVMGAIASVTYVIDHSGNTSLSDYAPLIAVGGGFVIDLLMKLVKDNGKQGSK